MLTALTPEQTALLSVWRDKWIAHGLSTEPADRPAAEAGVIQAYRAAGLSPPQRFIWFDSPMAGAIAYSSLLGASVGASVWASVWDSVGSVRASVWASVWDSVGSVGDSVRASVWDSVGSVRASVWASVGDGIRDVWASVWDSVGSVGDSVRASVRASVGDSVGDGIRDVWASVGGQHEAGWLSFYDYFREVCGLTVCQKLDGLIATAQSCGWWWPLTDAVLLTERPCTLRRDDRGRLHCADGAAVAYPDGWSIYAWHGTRIPERYYLQPVTAPEILAEPNAEVRRALMERYGVDRFILDIDVTVLDEHDDNQLLVVPLEGDPDEKLVALKLRCPSTAAVYVLRVPPNQTTVKGALAWSFGLESAAEYDLEIET